MDITIRLATPEDAGALLGIYSYYVENTPITYELKCPISLSRCRSFRHAYRLLLCQPLSRKSCIRPLCRDVYLHRQRCPSRRHRNSPLRGIGKTPLCAGYSQSLCQHYRKRRAFYTFSCKAWLYQSSPFPQMWTQICPMA